MERPIAILDKKSKILSKKVVKLVRLQCQHRKGSEWTWESDEEMREHHPELFTIADFEDGV